VDFVSFRYLADRKKASVFSKGWFEAIALHTHILLETKSKSHKNLSRIKEYSSGTTFRCPPNGIRPISIARERHVLSASSCDKWLYSDSGECFNFRNESRLPPLLDSVIR
jgi:hypothetical protein